METQIDLGDEAADNFPGSVVERPFWESFDAREWARAFARTCTENPAIATDEGTLIGWFANALMRGYDEHRRRS